MLERFLITGSGRSGTKFLVEVMNQSNLWTVKHEINFPTFKLSNGLNHYSQCVNEIGSRFVNKRYYGEVNGQLLWYVIPYDFRQYGKSILQRWRLIPKLNRRGGRLPRVDKCGVIIRDPLEIAASMMNRKKNGEWDDIFLNIEERLYLIDASISFGFLPIYFRRMTTEVDYLQEIIRTFGINDVKVTDEMIQKKVNHNKTYLYSAEDVPKPWPARYAWYQEKYVNRE